MTKYLLSVFLAVLVSSSFADAGSTPFLITNRTSSLDPNNPAEAALLAAFNSAADNIQTTINTGILSQSSRTTFADGLARANSSGTSSFYADRASNPDRFSVGVGLQAGLYAPQGAFSASSSANNSLPDLGVGAQTAILVGLPARTLHIPSFGPIVSDRLFFTLVGMGVSSHYKSVGFSVFNVGLNAQYKLIPGVGLRFLASWGGINVVTGLNYASNSVDYAASLSQSSTTTAGGANAVVNVNLNYDIGVKSSTFTIPFETSTNFTVLYFVTAYAGGGFDVNFGSSSLTGTANGPLTASTTSGISTSNLFSGNAGLNLNDGTAASPAAVIGRYFAGLQVNVSIFKVDVEYSDRSNGAQSVAFIARAAF